MTMTAAPRAIQRLIIRTRRVDDLAKNAAFVVKCIIEKGAIVITAALVNFDSLKALDLKRPIREADISCALRQCF